MCQQLMLQLMGTIRTLAPQDLSLVTPPVRVSIRLGPPHMADMSSRSRPKGPAG